MSDIKPKARMLGITGGIACGKSEVGRILDDLGFDVCDADLVAHGLMERGNPVYQRVVDCFGPGILSEDGGISRPALGKIVFEDPRQLEHLNALVHPAVRSALATRIDQMRAENKAAAVLLPLLFESEMQDLDWDATVCVSSPPETIFQRLEKRGLSKEEAEQRVCSQMPLAEKEHLADYVIPNSGTLGELKMAVREIVEAIMLER